MVVMAKSKTGKRKMELDEGSTSKNFRSDDTIRVLVVGDYDKRDAEIMHSMLVPCCQYQVEICKDAKEASYLVSNIKNGYDVVFHFPKTNGFEPMLKIVGLKIDVPIIIMSPVSETGFAIKDGALDFISESISIAMSWNKWHQVISKKNQIGKQNDNKAACPSSISHNMVTVKEENIGDGGCERENLATRIRMTWTPQLEKKFVDAFNLLGEKGATPMKIHNIMKEPLVRISQIKSHLQNHREKLKNRAGANELDRTRHKLPDSSNPPQMVAEMPQHRILKQQLYPTLYKSDINASYSLPHASAKNVQNQFNQGNIQWSHLLAEIPPNVPPSSNAPMLGATIEPGERTKTSQVTETSQHILTGDHRHHYRSSLPCHSVHVQNYGGDNSGIFPFHSAPQSSLNNITPQAHMMQIESKLMEGSSPPPVGIVEPTAFDSRDFNSLIDFSQVDIALSITTDFDDLLHIGDGSNISTITNNDIQPSFVESQIEQENQQRVHLSESPGTADSTFVNDEQKPNAQLFMDTPADTMQSKSLGVSGWHPQINHPYQIFSDELFGLEDWNLDDFNTMQQQQTMCGYWHGGGFDPQDPIFFDED